MYQTKTARTQKVQSLLLTTGRLAQQGIQFLDSADVKHWNK
jgi:hypothetical protein